MVFGVGGVGALNAGALVLGSAAEDSTDRTKYNSATGCLYFDADGLGGRALVALTCREAYKPPGAGRAAG